ncbi:MAG: hypothetical protein ACR2MN_13495 [Acidimicrobiales bacterium]
MRAFWMFHRRALIAAAVAVVLVVATVTALASQRSPAVRRPSAHPRVGAHTATRGSPARGTPTSHPYLPSLVDPPDTPVQRQISAELSKAESPASIAAAEALVPPKPETSRAFPAVPDTDRVDANDYAAAFATELLDVNYATQARDGLLAWVQSEEAANTLPGVPPSVADRALYGSIAYPDLPGGTPSPTPSSAVWAANGTTGLTQTVSNLGVSESPEWTSVVATGWQPRDELMSVQVVTGTLTVTGPGRPPTATTFSLTLTLGSAAHHPGLGAVAAGQWQEA